MQTIKDSRLAPTAVKTENVHQFINKLWSQRYLWLMILPGLIFYILFCYYPMAGLIIAFKRFDPTLGMFASPWAGFKYFQQFLENPFLWRLIRNTFLLSFYTLLFGFPAPIIFAILLNEIHNGKIKKMIQTVSYLPYFISIVVVMGILRQLVSEDSGVVNLIIEQLGGDRINFFMSKQWFRTLYVSSSIWQNLGWNSIIYLAAISAIDMQLYEAAIIDGAGRLRRMWHITLPGLAPTIIVIMILNIGNILNLGYEKVILMYNPGTYEVADIVSTYVFRTGLRDGSYSLGTAVGLLNSVVALVFLVGANFISGKVTQTSLW